MNKYKKLVANTFIFGIGTFSSKLLVFLLMPLYTRLLTTAEYGVIDIIVGTAQLLFPVVGLSIGEGVMRFGIDKQTDKKQVFTTGISTVGVGFLVFLCFIPIFLSNTFIKDYTTLVYLYVLMACVNNVCMNFVRSQGRVKLYAFTGFLASLLVVVFNIIALVILDLGIVGFVMSTILSDLCCIVFLVVTAKLYKFFNFTALNKTITKQMIKYSAPMITNSLFWWITNVSDRYFVIYFLGEAINGLYAVAYKIPTIINVIVLIFTQAWNISAFTEYDDEKAVSFFSTVFKTYRAVIFIAGAFIIALIKPLTAILVSADFFDSWKYVPLLVLSVVFSCFVTFLGSIYMANKKNTMSMVTTLIGAISNVVMNFLLIPKYGANGAAFATAMSYLIVFIIRAIDTRRFMKINYSMGNLLANMVLICAQAYLSITDISNMWIYQFLFVVLIIAVNFKLAMSFVQKILSKYKK